MSAIVFSGSTYEPNGISVPFDVRLPLGEIPERRVFVLASDAPVAVNLDGATIVALMVESNDAPVDVHVTTGTNADQIVTVDPFQILCCRRAPITALSLVRSAGQAATVVLTLGRATD